MIFFYKYVTPTWYFNLSSNNPRNTVFSDYRKIPSEYKGLISYDAGYDSQFSSLFDASYQALQKGYLESDSDNALPIEYKVLNVSDNYRFLRRFFHPSWSWYVLFLRLVTFNNPINEFKGFRKNLGVKRLNLFQEVFFNERFLKDFDSHVVSKSPKVSVIIPTLNRYDMLRDALIDLENQVYPNFDVIIVDQSDAYAPSFYDEFKLDIKLIRQREKALWQARNRALQSTTSEYILLYDDDSRMGPTWIIDHLKCLDFFDVDISTGVSVSVIGGKVPEEYKIYKWGDQLDTGNSMFKASVFSQIGLFDLKFEKQRMGDGEFGLRAYLAGCRIVSNPAASRIHLKGATGGLRDVSTWDGWRPRRLFDPRPVPSVLYFYRKYFGKKMAVLSLIRNVPISITPYKHKSNSFYIALSSFLTIPLMPLLLYQIFKSWSISTKMLNE